MIAGAYLLILGCAVWALIATGFTGWWLALNILSLWAFLRNWQYKDRLRLVFVLAAVQLCGFSLGGLTDAFSYYAVCGMFDFCTIILLHRASKTTMAMDLQMVSFTSLLTNVVGWLLYEMYVPSTYYNIAITVLLAIQLTRLMLITPYDLRDLDDTRDDLVCGLCLDGVPDHKAKP